MTQGTCLPASLELGVRNLPAGRQVRYWEKSAQQYPSFRTERGYERSEKSPEI
jgi:hypothetical protein